MFWLCSTQNINGETCDTILNPMYRFTSGILRCCFYEARTNVLLTHCSPEQKPLGTKKFRSSNWRTSKAVRKRPEGTRGGLRTGARCSSFEILLCIQDERHDAPLALRKIWDVKFFSIFYKIRTRPHFFSVSRTGTSQNHHEAFQILRIETCR